MLRLRHLPFVLLVPFGVVASAGADETAKKEAPATQIDVPRLDGIIGAPSIDLQPAPAPQQASASPVEQKPEPVITETPKAAAAAASAQTSPPTFALAFELAERISKDKSGATKDDRDAATKFYEMRQGAPVWTTEAGFNGKASALIAEIGKAADWGLAADAFKLPAALSSGASRNELADAEATLTLAALKPAADAWTRRRCRKRSTARPNCCHRPRFSKRWQTPPRPMPRCVDFIHSMRNLRS
jgi:Scaffold domain